MAYPELPRRTTDGRWRGSADSFHRWIVQFRWRRNGKLRRGLGSSANGKNG